MNLISLMGALLTASASVLNHPIKENHQNKMMDVEYKYESNEVNSSDDLIIGHVYYLDIDDALINEFVYQGGFMTFELLTNLSIDGEHFTYDEFLGSNSVNKTLLEFYNDSGIGYVRVYLQDNFETDYNLNLFYNGVFNSSCVIQLLAFNNVEWEYFKYTDYNEIVPSSSHRGNLYTIIYDFFYGIFDTSDTNELSMTILGQEMSLTSWLSHTVTIILLLLGVLWLILVVKWIFRVFSGLIKV